MLYPVQVSRVNNGWEVTLSTRVMAGDIFCFVTYSQLRWVETLKYLNKVLWWPEKTRVELVVLEEESIYAQAVYRILTSATQKYFV